MRLSASSRAMARSLASVALGFDCVLLALRGDPVPLLLLLLLLLGVVLAARAPPKGSSMGRSLLVSLLLAEPRLADEVPPNQDLSVLLMI